MPLIPKGQMLLFNAGLSNAKRDLETYRFAPLPRFVHCLIELQRWASERLCFNRNVVGNYCAPEVRADHIKRNY